MKAFNTKKIAMASLFALGLAGHQYSPVSDSKNEISSKPNFIIIFADDLVMSMYVR